MERERAREVFMAQDGAREEDFATWWRTRQVPGVGDNGTPLLVLEYDEAVQIDSWLPGWWEKGEALVVARGGFGQDVEPATAGVTAGQLRVWDEIAAAGGKP